MKYESKLRALNWSRMQIATTTVSALLMHSLTANAAIPHKGMGLGQDLNKPGKISLDVTRAALKLPLEQRLETLSKEGEQGYRNLVGLMFNESLPMETRWRAVTASGRIAGDLAKPELQRAFKSHDWYMRNAALLSMSHIDRNVATDWARQLLNDKSLVVRTAAVSTLADYKDQASAALLWEKLYAKDNFRGKQSLFIRRHIVEALAKLQLRGSESQFIEVLADNDASLHRPAIQALELLTAKQLGKATDPLTVKRAQWQRWWKEKSQTL